MSNLEKFRVFVSSTLPPKDLSRLQHCDVTVCDGNGYITFDELKKGVVGAHGIFINPLVTVNKEILDAAGPQLKVVSTGSVGLEHINLEECKRRGIKVGFAPNAMNAAVAELTLALTLMTARNLEQALRSVYDGIWGSDNDHRNCQRGNKQVSGSVIGIVGLGRIGFATAKLFTSFAPSKLLYCGKTPKSYAAEINAEFVAFNDLLSMSDIVVVTCSLNNTNRHMFNAEAFSRMKNSSIFINVSRGAVVDQEALYTALTTKQIAGAGLDVTTPEPLPNDHKLLRLPNCLVSPHIASDTDVAVDAILKVSIDNILAGLKGEPLPSSAY